MPTVAIGSDFLDAFARVPRAQQRKVREFTEKFKTNPKSAAINYEKINDVKDEKIRTVRIDQKYRAVVLHPPAGDVYILVWVDNHDEAMDWAKKRSFDVNPQTGALQVVSVTEAEEAVGSQKRSTRKGLFATLDDDELLSLGLPAVLLPSVRGVQAKDELTALGKHLPAEVTEALMWLSDGIPLEEVREAVKVPAKPNVDTTDLAAALEHPDTRRRFVAIQSDADLSAVLDAPLAKWRVFLHPSQERLIRKVFNGPARVLGGAGTGKTVVAMHRAKHLAETICSSPSDRLLFTTFTSNLSQNIDEMFKGWCPAVAARVEVVNIHAWAIRFLRDRKVDVQIASAEAIDECWRTAVSSEVDAEFDLGFLKLEWDHVVQMHGITTRAGYLAVSRAGRGKTLSRLQRAKVWSVFDRFRNSLLEQGVCEWLDVIRQARQRIELEKPKLPYKSVVVDEAQDFHPEEWKLIRSLVPPGPNDLFLVGDTLQRIYGRKVVLKECGLNILGRSSTLKINYRTTEQIRDWATSMLAGSEGDDLDGGKVDGKGYRSLLAGPQPEYCHFKTAREEQKHLVTRLNNLLKERPAESICLVTRNTKTLTDSYQALLKDAGIPHVVLGKGKEPGGPGVRLATMHRVKGLEFPVMLIAGLNAGVLPLRTASLDGDLTALAEHDEQERSLLYVAATRARDFLMITSWGTPSPFLSKPHI